MLKVGIIGAAGYTGAELVRLVYGHPELELCFVAAKERAGQPLGSALPSTLGTPALAQLKLETFEATDAATLKGRVDVVFTALPHTLSASVAHALLAQGLQVVDLSADFRLKDAAVYERAYTQHPHPELLSQAVYGLVELHRNELPGAQLIAAPGCYPTSSILPLAPLLKAGLIEQEGIIIDSKSGVSGAGRKASDKTHLPETAEGIRAYAVAGSHRHVPEIEQELSLAAGKSLSVVFTPHLCPMTRGLLSVAYARLKPGATADVCRAAARACYQEGLVSVVPGGTLVDTLWVRGSAVALVGYEVDTRTNTVLAMCVLDNLAKGASAQAIQALNVARGWPDATGLPTVAQFP